MDYLLAVEQKEIGRSDFKKFHCLIDQDTHYKVLTVIDHFNEDTIKIRIIEDGNCILAYKKILEYGIIDEDKNFLNAILNEYNSISND